MSRFGKTQIILNGIDFGSQDLYALEMGKNSLAIDGMLGMDFWRSHQLYIDNPAKVLYIGRTSPN